MRGLLANPAAKIGLVQVGTRLSGLLLGICLGRVLGAEGFGFYALAFAIANLLMVPAEAGVPQLLLRSVASHASAGQSTRVVIRRALRIVAVWSLGGSAAAIAVVLFNRFKMQPESVAVTLIALLMVPLAALLKTLAYGLRGLKRVVLGQFIDELLRPALVLIAVVGIFLAIPSFRTPVAAMTVQLGACAAALVVASWVVRNQLRRETTGPSAPRENWLPGLLSFSLVSGALVLNSQVDVIMLGWLRSAEEVGYYRVSVIAAALVAFGMQIANSLSAPRMAAHHARGEHVQLQAITTRNAQLALLCAMPLTIVLLTAGGPIAGALFGAEFQLSHLPMSILAVGQLGNVLFGSVGVLLSMTGHEAHVARALWLTTLTNVAFNALLIPLFGTAGAAMATGSSAALGNAMLLYVVHRRLKLNTTVFPWLKNQFSNWRV